MGGKVQMNVFESTSMLTGLIYNDEDIIERNNKEQEYLNYIRTHVSHVIQAFDNLILPLKEKTNICSTVGDQDLYNAIDKLSQNINYHDNSKYSDEEFAGYRARWYPTTMEAKGDEEYQNRVEEVYQECWNHHRFNNPHHPDYWVNRETGVSKDMDLDAILEMICDWEGVSAQFCGNTLEWYENDATEEKKALSDNTKTILEDLLYNVIHNTKV